MISEDRITPHALIRMAQRSMQSEDLDLILWIGTEVQDGYFVRKKDCQTVERALRHLLTRVQRLKGKRMVVLGDHVITAYHARHRKERRLLRHAEERSLVGQGC